MRSKVAEDTRYSRRWRLDEADNGLGIGTFDAAGADDEAFDIRVASGGRPVIVGDSYATPYQKGGMTRLEYDLVFTGGFETPPRGRLPGQ